LDVLMPYELVAQYLKLPLFLLVVARLAGMVAFQPILAAVSVPAPVRLLLVLALAALVTPFVSFPGRLPDTVLGLTIAMVGELALGVLIGMVVAITLAGVQLGAELIAQESGLAYGQMVDPTTNQSVTVLSTFYTQLAAVMYLVVGGHRILLAACLDTFQAVPLLGSAPTMAAGTEMLLQTLVVATSLAIRVAAPAMLTLFLVNAALGFISRTVPQLDIATLGFSMKSLIAFVVMAVALPSAMVAFTDALDLSFDWLHRVIG
jgi:flagellar biosynthesis protein FliR